MLRLFALILGATLLFGCASREYDLESEQAARVGVNYASNVKRARGGDEATLTTLLRVTQSLDGGGAEGHSYQLHLLLTQYGDTRFAAILRRESTAVRQSVIDSLDFAFLVYVRRPHWSSLFPATYALARHPVLRNRPQKPKPTTKAEGG